MIDTNQNIGYYFVLQNTMERICVSGIECVYMNARVLFVHCKKKVNKVQVQTANEFGMLQTVSSGMILMIGQWHTL